MYYVVAAPKRISPHFKLAPADANVNVNVSISSSPLFDVYLHRPRAPFALQTPSSLIPSGYSYNNNYSLSLRSSSLLLFLCCCLVLTLEIVRLRDLCLWSVFGTLRALSPFRCVHCFRVRYLFFFVFFFSLSLVSLRCALRHCHHPQLCTLIIPSLYFAANLGFFLLPGTFTVEGYYHFVLAENLFNRQNKVSASAQSNIFLCCVKWSVKIAIIVCMNTEILGIFIARTTKLSLNMYFNCAHIKLVLVFFQPSRFQK